MIFHRKANTRGNPTANWITSFRTFYFPPYMDKTYTNFGDLETINDDRTQPGGHVPEHLHRNMEIFGYVVEGKCRHTDSFGKSIDIPAGGVQRMSAGRGIKHTEGNASDQPNRYLQLWIRPNVLNTEPSHDWHQFSKEDKLNRFCDITEKLPIKQNARLLAGIFTNDFTFQLNSNRRYYLYVVSGNSTLNGIDLIEGDGLAFTNETEINIQNPNETEIILFDLV